LNLQRFLGPAARFNAGGAASSRRVSLSFVIGQALSASQLA